MSYSYLTAADYRKIEHLRNPEFTQENRLNPVSDHKWYTSYEDAECMKEMNLKTSLNGNWFFHYASNPQEVPVSYEEKTYDCKNWKQITVPAQIELCGYGCPQYTDTGYPWDGIEEVKPHDIPLKHNPTGCYVRYFDIPEIWDKHRTILQFDGVEDSISLSESRKENI